MEDTTAEAVKGQLDRALSAVGRNVGIAFGVDLFDAFKSRGWIELKRFSGILGTSFGGTKLPAYGTHYAFRTWDLRENEFKVGIEVAPKAKSAQPT
jgi:hypothetical protein